MNPCGEYFASNRSASNQLAPNALKWADLLEISCGRGRARPACTAPIAAAVHDQIGAGRSLLLASPSHAPAGPPLGHRLIVFHVQKRLHPLLTALCADQRRWVPVVNGSAAMFPPCWAVGRQTNCGMSAPRHIAPRERLDENDFAWTARENSQQQAAPLQP